MKFFRSRRSLVVTGVLAVVIIAAWMLTSRDAPADSSITARATRGEFMVPVTTSGELRARQFVQITAPANAQQAGAFQMRIQSLVPEGTIVRAGDVVAEIDRSTLATRMNDVTLAVQRADAQMEQAMLDSTLNLSTAREAIRNLEMVLEERRLANEQAVYEAPTVRRQAEIDLERAQRQLAQARTDYTTRTEQAQARMREVGAEVQRQHNLLRVVQEVMTGFTIRAPSPGMVIYVKEWNGRKRTVGSQVSSWDAAVATLPDLSQMESVTYVNEIDVRKVAVGQSVVITLDSDPTKRLAGTVASVANVGEQRPNADAKVFEVRVTVTEPDTTLRPGMTTGNAIETLRIPDALFVPLEAMYSENGVAFVYHQTGGRVVKREVVAGAMNDHEVIIERGLDENDLVLLTVPLNADRLELLRLDGSVTPPGAPGDSTPRDSAPASTDSSPAAPATADTSRSRRAQ